MRLLDSPFRANQARNTGYLMSGLALTYASTGNLAALDKGRYIVSQLAALP